MKNKFKYLRTFTMTFFMIYFLCSLSLPSHSQTNTSFSLNYKSLAQQPGSNYDKIVQKAREEFKQQYPNAEKMSKAQKQFERWAAYWENRVDAQGRFPGELDGYFYAGILDAQGKIVPESSYKTTSEESWINVGPEQSTLDANGYPNYPQMGRLNVLLRIPHPTDLSKDVLLVGAPNGGIWKSTDGGANWTPKLDFVAGIGVTDIKIAPGASFTNYTTKPIYISTGDNDGSNIKSIGVLKSTDGGETFVSTGLSSTLDKQLLLGDLIVYDDTTVLVVGMDSIRKTKDGGASWYSVFPTDQSKYAGRGARMGTSVIFTLEDGSIAYNPDLNQDNGWQRKTVGSGPMSISPYINNSFMIQDNLGNLQTVDKASFISTPFGSGPSTQYQSQGGFNQGLYAATNFVLSGGVNGYYSGNGGFSWIHSLNGYKQQPSDPGIYVHSDIHRIGSLDGNNKIWVCHDGGLDYVDVNNPITATTEYKSGKVIVTQSYSAAINPSSASSMAYMMANQDNDVFSKTGNKWYAVEAGDGIQCAINYENEGTRYSANTDGKVTISNVGFKNEAQGNGSTLIIPGVYFEFPFEFNTTDTSIIYAGGAKNVYLVNTGTLQVSATSASFSSKVNDIATQGNTVLACDNNSIQLSSDKGNTWQAVTAPSTTSNSLSSVDINGTNNQIMYAALKGYGNARVYKSTNGGTSWTNITGDLPNVVINEILLKQNQSQEFLFVATEIGVYYTSNGGQNWKRLGKNLPYASVRDIDIHYTADKLVAATFGRGLWEVNIMNSTLGIQNQIPTLDFAIYPNPAQNYLHIHLDNIHDYEYMIYNVVGGIEKQGKLNTTEIDISQLARDHMYVIKVYSEKEEGTQKFLKK